MIRVMAETKLITLSPGFACFRFFKVLSPLLSEMTNYHSLANFESKVITKLPHTSEILLKIILCLNIFSFPSTFLSILK